MKFTKEEISLCKQIAERYRKEIEIGGWALFENEVRLIIKAGFDIESPTTGEKEKFVVFDDPTIPNLRKLTIHLDRIIPLWTISDCLEFLREKGLTFSFYHYDVEKYFFECGYVNKRPWSDIVAYKTPLEACLKAVLAVLEDEEK